MHDLYVCDDCGYPQPYFYGGCDMCGCHSLTYEGEVDDLSEREASWRGTDSSEEDETYWEMYNPDWDPWNE